MSIKKYEIAKEAAVVPMADPMSQKALTEDIRQNGLVHPITLWRGKIVDGRCRYKACQELDLEPETVTIDWDMNSIEVMDWVKSVNTRRNLSTTQRAIIAHRLAKTDKNVTLAEAAAKWAVGSKTVENARFIIKHRPEFEQPLFDGKGVQIISKGIEINTDRINSLYKFVKEEVKAAKEAAKHEVEGKSKDVGDQDIAIAFNKLTDVLNSLVKTEAEVYAASTIISSIEQSNVSKESQQDQTQAGILNAMKAAACGEQNA